jgi:hypothetical protein
VGQPERTHKNPAIYSLYLMIKRDRISLLSVWERTLKSWEWESWNDSQITGHTVSATAVTQMGVNGQYNAPADLPPQARERVPIVQEAGWAPGLVWTGAENLTPNRNRSPDCAAHSESLYQLSYPGPLHIQQYINKSLQCKVLQQMPC